MYCVADGCNMIKHYVMLTKVNVYFVCSPHVKSDKVYVC